tara:strand:+ start:243 stop:482 length:240 start_codon:yes stop_codon:yes gene_type:complete
MDQENPDTKKETVLINGKEHNVADLSREQITFINHVSDLDGKSRQINFSLEQTLGARDHFMGLLNASLEAKSEDKAVNE